jgi:hypothetical protein
MVIIIFITKFSFTLLLDLTGVDKLEIMSFILGRRLVYNSFLK